MKKLLLSIFFISFISISKLFSQAYEIKVNIKNLPNDTIILGYHLNAQLIPADTAFTDKKGFAVFTGKNLLPGGMYFIFLPNKQLFDFLLDKNQKFTIIADTTNFLNSVSYKGNEENSLFIDYQKFLSKMTVKQDSLKNEYTKYAGDAAKQEIIKKEFEELNSQRATHFNNIIDNHSDLFFAKFLKATKQVEIPPAITEREAQYNYYRAHYFDYFDISDSRLLRTPIYEDKINLYIDKLLPQHPDTLIIAVDMLIEKSRSDKALFKYMLINLFNKYASSQLMSAENVYVHIADKYYIKEAEWSSKEFIDELKTKIVDKKKCLFGNTTKDIEFRVLQSDSLVIKKHMERIEKYKQDGITIEGSKANDQTKIQMKIDLLGKYVANFNKTGSLYTTKADYIILWFWTPDCSHCRKETPEFYEEYMQKKMNEKNVKVISVFMSKDIAEWSKHTKILNDWLLFVKKHEMKNWINVWNPFDEFRSNYDLQSTPILYLLDSEKKILAKKISYKQAFEIIEKDIEMKNKK